MTRIVQKPAIARGALVAAALGLAACAPMEAPEADEYDATLANIDTSRACFFTREINGYSNAPDGPRGRERLYVRTGVREEWLLETVGSCPELDFSHQIALDTRGRTSVCTGYMETLLVPDSFGDRIDRCQVRVLGRVIQQEEGE